MLVLILISVIILILALFYIQSRSSLQYSDEGFAEERSATTAATATATAQGLLSQLPSPDVNASPANSQPVEAEPAFIASAPGVIPGAVELSQGTTAFITNAPSAFTQQFAQATIVTNQQANSAYKDILQYLTQNPEKSTDFLNDIRRKFFDSSALFKENIDFRELAAAPNMVFNS